LAPPANRAGVDLPAAWSAGKATPAALRGR